MDEKSVDVQNNWRRKIMTKSKLRKFHQSDGDRTFSHVTVCLTSRGDGYLISPFIIHSGKRISGDILKTYQMILDWTFLKMVWLIFLIIIK